MNLDSVPFDLKNRNRAYYDAEHPGRRDYWRWMAAPRARLEMLLAEMAKASWREGIDLGCGDGTLLEALGRRFPGARLAGADLSSVQIEANRRARPDIDWRVLDLDGDGAVPEIWRGRFDVVVASEVVEHLESPDRLFRHAWALAAPGGRLLVTTQSGKTHATEIRVGHRRHFEAEDLRRRLEFAGWSSPRVWNAGYPFHDWSKRLANLRPAVAWRVFGDRAYSWPQKSVCAVLRFLFSFNSSRRGAQLYGVAFKPETADGSGPPGAVPNDGK